MKADRLSWLSVKRKACFHEVSRSRVKVTGSVIECAPPFWKCENPEAESKLFSRGLMWSSFGGCLSWRFRKFLSESLKYVLWLAKRDIDRRLLCLASTAILIPSVLAWVFAVRGLRISRVNSATKKSTLFAGMTRCRCWFPMLYSRPRSRM